MLSFAFHIGGLIQHFLVHLILLEYAIVLFTSYRWDDMLFSCASQLAGIS